MASRGRQAAIGLCALATAATAGCAASPRYPVQEGQAPGDGGLHMTQRPQYPIDTRADAAASGYGPAPAPAYAPAPAAAPAYAPPPADQQGAAAAHGDADPAADDTNELAHAPAGSAPVDSSDIPPPPPAAPDATSVPAPQAPGRAALDDRAQGFQQAAYVYAPSLPFMIDDGAAPAAAGFELAAYRHHHHAVAAPDDQDASDQKATGKKASRKGKARETTSIASSDDGATPRHGRRRHGKASQAEDQAAQADETTTSRHGRHRRGAKAEPVDQTAQADDTPAPTRHGRHRRGAKADQTDQTDQTAQADDTSTKRGRRHRGATEDQAQQATDSADAASARHGRRGARAQQAEAQDQAASEDTGRRSSREPVGYTYEIKKGDTLYAVARRYDVDPTALAKLNGAHTRLQPGDTIELPAEINDKGRRGHAAGAAVAELPPPRVAKAETRKARHAADTDQGGDQAANPPQAATAVASADTPTAADRAATRKAEREARLAARAARRHPSPTPASSAAAPSVFAAAPTARPASPKANQDIVASIGAAGPTSSFPVARTTPSAPAAATASSAPWSGSSASTSFPAAATAQRPQGSPYEAQPTPAARPSVPVAPRSYAAAGATAPVARPYGAPYPTTAPVARPYGAPYPTTAPASGSSYVPGQVATLNAPSYRGPTLGRARPVTPTLSAGTLSDADVAAAGRGRFVWPLRGAILLPFGDRGEGQRNDGLDIAAQPGESVRAAAGGEVVYAGSSIPGFGNLVLVKHPGGWVTAYAHLDRIEVRMRDPVSQGEEIGLAGQTGAVSQPQLHFEVRYAPESNEKARPINPALVLPGAG